MSGAKASRPALNRLIADAKARRFDCVLVWKLDRFGRSLEDCLNNIRELEENGIRFIAVTQNFDTDAFLAESNFGATRPRPGGTRASTPEFPFFMLFQKLAAKRTRC